MTRQSDYFQVDTLYIRPRIEARDREIRSKKPLSKKSNKRKRGVIKSRPTVIKGGRRFLNDFLHTSNIENDDTRFQVDTFDPSERDFLLVL